MTEVTTPTHCSACKKLLQYKWFAVELFPEEINLGGMRSGIYGICRPCFLKAMGVLPNGKAADVEEVREMPAGQPGHVRTRRTAVSKADIDRYRRSARADRDNKKAAADRASGDAFSKRHGEGWGRDKPNGSDEYGELPASEQHETNGTDDSEVS